MLPLVIRCSFAVPRFAALCFKNATFVAYFRITLTKYNSLIGGVKFAGFRGLDGPIGLPGELPRRNEPRHYSSIFATIHRDLRIVLLWIIIGVTLCLGIGHLRRAGRETSEHGKGELEISVDGGDMPVVYRCGRIGERADRGDNWFGHAARTW
jgi:hypothetical protein